MIPTALYIHIPWCIQKCPYCDFNSHKSPEHLPEKPYIDTLLNDLKRDIECYGTREIISIFIGGGTPSLLDGASYHYLLTSIHTLLPFAKNIEITLEANPGTVEQHRFNDYRQAGINRLSIGIQSFQPHQLKRLGRIHDSQQAHLAIDAAKKAGFDNFNLDLMHGLPQQTIDEAILDLNTALAHEPTHLSWYQLTIEPNTVFYKKPPVLPHDDLIAEMEDTGFALLDRHGYSRYEISAFAKPDRESRHNLNYWVFGDYYGIGAGAHGKLTHLETHQIIRTQKQRQPKDYLDPQKSLLAQTHDVQDDERIFEFMLNTTRLNQPITTSLFEERTGLPRDRIELKLDTAVQKGLLKYNETGWQITTLGRRFTNDLQTLFLP